nr:PEP-CTERM sorting domain-containing protein [uncultured Rhodopila sp.]
MMKKTLLALAIALNILVTFVQTSSAQPVTFSVPASSAVVTITPILHATPETASGAPSASLEYVSGPTTAIALAGGYPAGGVSAYADNLLSDNEYASTVARASLGYYFEIGGPAGVMVPIEVSGSLLASGSSLGCCHGGGGSASLMVGSFINESVSASGCTNRVVNPNGGSICVGPFEQATVVAYSGDVLSDTPVLVTLTAVAGALYRGEGSSSADPTFTIDPGFADASEFSVILSDGVGNSLASDVPEPTASLALLGTSLLGLGLIRRRRA